MTPPNSLAAQPLPASDLTPLRTAGIVIAPNEAQVIADYQSGSASPLELVDVQARRLMADTTGAGGVLGSDLDRVAPVTDGVPPMSFVLAAWISVGTSPAAAAARVIMGDQDWSHAQQVRYPWAVAAMFVNDVATAVVAGDGAPTTATATSASVTGAIGDASTTVAQPSHPPSSTKRPRPLMQSSLGRSLPNAPPDGPCTAVTNFLSSVFNGLFDALKINPGANAGTLVQVLAFLGNAALGLAKNGIQGLLTVLTAPALAVIRTGIAALGVATLVVSFFKNQTLTVTLDPEATNTDVYRFSIGSEAPISGVFVATAKDLSSDFPPALVDCANAAGAPLPKLIEPGADAIWTVNNDFGVIIPGSLNTKVGDDLTARLNFTTNNESEETAKGEVTFDPAIATVKIPRKAVDDFLRFARAQVDGAKTALINNVPAGPARDAAVAAAKQFIDPTLDQLNAAVSNQVGGAFALTGSTGVVVKHHRPPDTTTSSTTTTTLPAPTIVQGVEVHLDRPAVAPLLAGRVVDLVSCDGLFGHWTGVIRNGGIQGPGISQPFNDIRVDFTVGGSDKQTIHTQASSTFSTQIGPVTVALQLDITVDDTRLDSPKMTITGTGSSAGQNLEVGALLGQAASNIPINKAPAGRCP